MVQGLFELNIGSDFSVQQYFFCWSLTACHEFLINPPVKSPGAHFSKALETFRARKAIFSSSVSKNREVYTSETSCMKGTCGHIKNN